MILKELFANFAILTSLIFLYTQLIKTPLNRSSKLKYKIHAGIVAGISSDILMFYSIDIGDTIFDLRHIPLILVAFYGGITPITIALLFFIVGRLMIGFSFASYIAICYILTVSVITLLLSSSKVKMSLQMKIAVILTANNVLLSVIAVFLVDSKEPLSLLIPTYWVASYSAGVLAFYMLVYLRKTKLLLDKYKLESTTDGLTGLNNVRKFDEVFNTLTNNVGQKEEKLSLLYIDIDFFKHINDTYGHGDGDIVLKELGALLSSSTRSFDIVSRNGGEEFSVILLDCSLERANEISERIRKNVEQFPFTLSSGEEINITVSIGVASYPETTNDVSVLIEEADKALYQAKRSGRNRVCMNYEVNQLPILTSV
ncbi:GGDEF domain-containing protein [Niallia taxi]|uniref:GGDEF domain-containing protein n=1 Tax=Niallia taxi TaxID=2499688 RepID=UPI002E1E31D1|nr:diguanylate cyclase [Niallia taxi]MED3960998.1 diguanylate cyclase [Niallia taxi]